MKRAWFIAIMLINIMCCNSCKHQSSKLTSVNLPQSAAQEQGDSNLCWSYTIAAYLEANNLTSPKPIPNLNLSEEYLAFYHMYQQVQEFVRAPNSLNASTVGLNLVKNSL